MTLENNTQFIYLSLPSFLDPVIFVISGKPWHHEGSLLEETNKQTKKTLRKKLASTSA
jgi:hypothetical protein